MTTTLSYSHLKIGKARRQLEGKNDFLTMSKCYGRLNFSAISLLRAQPPKMKSCEKVASARTFWNFQAL